MFKKIHRELKKESCRKIGNGFLVMALICCLMFVSYQATSAVITSAKVGDRELPIYCVDTTEKKVALSFDAAWGAEDFPRIMDVLDKHKVKVTFFMTGGWVEDNPDCVKELVKRGHDLGNHSEHHYDMTTISQEEKDSELKTVHDKVKKLTGYEMYLFRPPYGAYDNDVIKTAYAMHYYPIQWSVDSLDWKNYGVDSIITTVCNHKALAPGAIILCHNGPRCQPCLRFGRKGTRGQMPLVQRGIHLRFEGLLRGQLGSVVNTVAAAALGQRRAALLGVARGAGSVECHLAFVLVARGNTGKGAEHRRLHDVDRQASTVFFHTRGSRVATGAGVGLGVSRVVKGHHGHLEFLDVLAAQIHNIARQGRRFGSFYSRCGKTQRHGTQRAGSHKPPHASRNPGCTTCGSH